MDLKHIAMISLLASVGIMKGAKAENIVPQTPFNFNNHVIEQGQHEIFKELEGVAARMNEGEWY